MTLPLQHAVFVTDGDQASALAIMRSLGKKGIKVVVGHTHAATSTFLSKYCFKKILYRDPLYGENFVSDVIKAVIRYDCDVLFPVTDYSLMEISLRKEKFERIGVKIPIPNHETILTARDKLLTLKVAKKEGVPCPRTFTPASVKELNKVIHELGFPLVVKPRTGIGGAGIEYVRSKNELQKAFVNIRKAFGHYPIVQEFIPGAGNVYSVVCIFDERSGLKAAITMRKIREDPPTGGACTFGETVWSPQITDIGVNLLKKMGWYGIAAAELKIDPRDDKPKLMEINPRWFGYTSLAINAGIDLPFILYKIALGEDVRYVTKYDIGLKFSRLLHDSYTFFTKFLPSSKDKRKETLKFIGSYLRNRICFDFVSFDDPFPLFGFASDILLRNVGGHHKHHPSEYSFAVKKDKRSNVLD